MSETVATDIKLIVFQLNGKEYGISVHYVHGIEKVQHITRVPGTAPFVKGVINLRGVVTPIIDLRKRFGIEACEYTEATRVIIVVLDDIEVGLVVDAANDVIDITEDSIEPAPEMVGVEEDEYVKGVVKVDNRLLILIDLAMILDRKQIKVEGSEG
ncbi:chemotaxis protein CheW [Bacillus sp. V3B]|uniref:chemotaxis protein CheW n=1 Tax=Bacillus sp. V3B TaxID=2804915 RepID=UPI00210D4D39|nr:chemotaxis protein CheW [Bacillus sp. V3B]MCQ6274116.1 chemotaxis protein CheW [Bacillus sp. V3B]